MKHWRQALNKHSPRLVIHEVKLINIVNDVTKLSKLGFCCTDVLLKELMKNNQLSIGKVIVIIGDFQQTLPIVLSWKRVTCHRELQQI